MAWSGIFENRLGSVFPQDCAKGALAFYKEAGHRHLTLNIEENLVPDVSETSK